MTRILGTLNTLFAVAFVALAGVMELDPFGRFAWTAVTAMFAAVGALEWVTYRREQAIKAAVWPSGEQLREWRTADLIAKHAAGQAYINLGSPAAPGDDALYAIEEVLRHRGVPLCGCGAAPGGVHLTNCPEKP